MGQAAQVGPYTAQGGMIREKPFDCDCGGGSGGDTPAAPSLANVVANQKRGSGGASIGGPTQSAPGAGVDASQPPPELVAAAQAGDPQAQSDLQNWLGGAALVGGAGGAAYLASRLMKSRGGAPGVTGVSGAPPMQEMQALPAPIDAEYRVVDDGPKSLANSVADRKRLTHDTHGPVSRRNPAVRTPANESDRHPTISGQEPPQDIKAREVEGAYQQRGAQNEANMEAERLAAVLAQRYKVQRAGKALSRVVR